MKLPIRFPNDADVFAEEAARFRRLSPEERLRTIRGILRAGALMIRRSPKSAFLRQYTLEQEELAHKAVKEFIARHADRE
ncbi:MAG: hypothetical protein WD066_19050 [Planctomycetaceae bacterium]